MLKPQSGTVALGNCTIKYCSFYRQILQCANYGKWFLQILKMGHSICKINCKISCQVCVFIPNTEALVLHYSEEEEGAGAAAAFLCTTNTGKLLQHKLIHVQCTKKSTQVPVSPVPQYEYSVLKCYF